MEGERPGRVILLNGASSSGKSSIGRALQDALPDPWFLFAVDALGAMRSTNHTRELDSDEVEAMLLRTRLGYHRAVAALASVGNDVIMDYPLSEPWRLDDLDRPVGLARSQSRVFGHDGRDIVVDTTHNLPAACAERVVSELDALPLPKAFERLRALRA